VLGCGVGVWVCQYVGAWTHMVEFDWLSVFCLVVVGMRL